MHHSFRFPVAPACRRVLVFLFMFGLLVVTRGQAADNIAMGWSTDQELSNVQGLKNGIKQIFIYGDERTITQSSQVQLPGDILVPYARGNPWYTIKSSTQTALDSLLKSDFHVLQWAHQSQWSTVYSGLQSIRNFRVNYSPTGRNSRPPTDSIKTQLFQIMQIVKAMEAKSQAKKQRETAVTRRTPTAPTTPPSRTDPRTTARIPRIVTAPPANPGSAGGSTTSDGRPLPPGMTLTLLGTDASTVAAPGGSSPALQGPSQGVPQFQPSSPGVASPGSVSPTGLRAWFDPQSNSIKIVGPYELLYQLAWTFHNVSQNPQNGQNQQTPAVPQMIARK